MSLSGDKIEIFKILNGYVNIDKNMFSSLKIVQLEEIRYN